MNHSQTVENVPLCLQSDAFTCVSHRLTLRHRKPDIFSAEVEPVHDKMTNANHLRRPALAALHEEVLVAVDKVQTLDHTHQTGAVACEVADKVQKPDQKVRAVASVQAARDNRRRRLEAVHPDSDDAEDDDEHRDEYAHGHWSDHHYSHDLDYCKIALPNLTKHESENSAHRDVPMDVAHAAPSMAPLIYSLLVTAIEIGFLCLAVALDECAILISISIVKSQTVRRKPIDYDCDCGCAA